MIDTQQIATEIRELVIKELTNAGSGHSAGSIDMADILTVLYFSDLLHLDPQKPDDPERDRIILSNGHICPLWYAVLAKRGYFPLEEIYTLRQFGSRLQGHPYKDFSILSRTEPLIPKTYPDNLPGIENTSGSLGQNTSYTVGLALGLRNKYQRNELSRLPKVICLCGDGELEEGQVWEAFLSASKFKLNNVAFIIDRNGIQIDGFTEDVMPLEPLKEKLESFGLLAIDIDGHNYAAIKNALQFDAAFQSKPTAIIAHTIPGKGIDFMEGRPVWHGKTPNLGEAVEALTELRTLQSTISND